ncbi:MAG TPA: hypothetical protein VFL93_08115 [Longimicrobiaceae bacterium]|nr:hypothetical protein [Longimicrobiaceae bacterium]
MTWLWILFGVLAVLAGARYRVHLHSSRSRGPRVDDDAVRRILDEGTLVTPDEDEPLDLDEAARAEEEFWSESWDEPEEFGR